MSATTSVPLPPPSPRPFVRIPRGARPAARRGWSRSVQLADIDLEDQRFQHRVVVSSDDLLESLRTHGQHTPVILWGKQPPYIVIDGFRRIGAITELGGDSVEAVVETDLDEQEAYARSFSENVRRRSLSAYDRGHAIHRALHRWVLDKRDLAALLALSVRQVDRYLALLEFDERLQAALAEERISMAQAVVLHRCSPDDLDHWIEDAATSGISAAELTQRLRRNRPSRSRAYLVRDPRGFRLRAVRYRADMSPTEKRRIWEALERALRVMAQS